MGRRPRRWSSAPLLLVGVLLLLLVGVLGGIFKLLVGVLLLLLVGVLGGIFKNSLTLARRSSGRDLDAPPARSSSGRDVILGECCSSCS